MGVADSTVGDGSVGVGLHEWLRLERIEWLCLNTIHRASKGLRLDPEHSHPQARIRKAINITIPRIEHGDIHVHRHTRQQSKLKLH
jgi:hypothetical protein